MKSRPQGRLYCAVFLVYLRRIYEISGSDIEKLFPSCYNAIRFFSKNGVKIHG